MKLTIHFKERNGYIYDIYTRLFDLHSGHISFTATTLTYTLSCDIEGNRMVLKDVYFDITRDVRKRVNGVISIHLTD